MKKLRILVDVDGIVTDSLPHWLEWIFNQTGVKAEPEQITQWVITDNPPLNQLKKEQVLDILNQPEFTISVSPMPGAIENLKKLVDDGHDVYLITARSGDVCIPETYRWLKQHMPWFDAEERVWFGYAKWMVRGDILIDDKLSTLKKYREEHPLAHLLTIDYPHNRGHDSAIGISRVANDEHAWDRLYATIKRIATYCE
jgi:5'(3')-deoxyribonucleotidase